MRPVALLERYRMALEVIANGAEWEPGTRTARLALLPPEVAMNPLVRYEPENVETPARKAQSDLERFWATSALCDNGRHGDCVLPGCPCGCHDKTGLSVNEAVERAREAEPKIGTLPTTTPADEPLDEPEVEEEKPGRVREKVGEDGLTDTQRAILTLIRERGEVNVPTVWAHVEGLTEAKLRRGLRLLRDRGEITVQGHSDTTTYKPVPPEPQPGLKPLRRAEPAPEEKPTGTDEGRLLESVRFKPAWSIAQHASRLDLHADKVSVAMRKLEAEGEVKAAPVNGRVVWKIR